MKKWTYLVAACMLAGTTPVITGCVDTDEPAGIEQLRGAKAELLRAQALVEAARVEYVKAQAAYEQARAAKVQAEADFYKAQAEYENAKTEKDKLIWAEELREKKAAVDAAIATSNAAKASQELAYINSMKAIEIAKASLTQEEYNLLWLQRNDIAVAKAEYDLLAGALSEAEANLSSAMNWLTDNQDNHEWQSYLEHEVRVAQYKYDAAVEAYNIAKANADLTNTDIPALQARVDDLVAYQDSVKKAGDELALEKAEWYAQHEEDTKIAEQELKDAKATVVELEAYSLTVDMSALGVVDNPTYEGKLAKNDYERYYIENAADGEWLDGASNVGEYVSNLEGFIEELNALKLDKNGIAWTTVSVNEAKAEKEKLQKEFNDTDNNAWEAAIKALNEGKGVKAGELAEYNALNTKLTAYNTAVNAYNAAVTAVTTATGALTQAGITAADVTEANIKAWQEIVDDENATKADSDAAQKKIDAANAYTKAVENQEKAKDALVGTPATADAEATEGAYDSAKGAFDKFVENILLNQSGSPDRWNVVKTAYGNPTIASWTPKTITADQIAAIAAVTQENVEAIIKAESEKLFGASFGSRLVAPTEDELIAQVKKDIEGLPAGTQIKPASEEVIEWNYTIDAKDVTDYQIEFFFLDGFIKNPDTTPQTTNYGKFGRIMQLASNETRGNAFISGNAKAVDDAVAYLQGYLDKAIGTEGALTLNNAAVAEKQAAYDKIVADVDAEFEKTSLGEEISHNKALQTMYEDLISKLDDTIKSFLGMHLGNNSSYNTEIKAHEWAELQDALDMLVNLAYDDMERAEDALLRAQKNQEEFLGDPQAYVEECTQVRDEAQAAFDEASAKLQAAIQALQDAIDNILATVQGL